MLHGQIEVHRRIQFTAIGVAGIESGRDDCRGLAIADALQREGECSGDTLGR